MPRRTRPVAAVAVAVAAALFAAAAVAQPPGGPPAGKGGPPGFGPFGSGERKLVAEFDTNKDGWLNAEERAAARPKAKEGGRRGFGPKGGFGQRGPETGPGPKVDPGSVKIYPDAPLFDPGVIRTVFLRFEADDWEQELEDFHGTDVDVPCAVTIDGKTVPNAGVHFRGMSSYGMVRAGQKRSFNVSLDMADEKQRFRGAKTLNLLNAHEDNSLLNTVLYSHVARQYMPAPKANLVKVVVNGESWGLYTNVQQFDKEFLKENYKTTKGHRWKVRGSPMGGAGLDYVGDDVAQYKRRYDLKGDDDPAAWAALVKLCKTLSETPADKLEAAVKPMLAVDEVLWFLALDVALINCDGYWVRASDYSLYRDDKGKFHVIPADMNEAFRSAQGPGVGGPRGGGPGRGPGGPGGGPGGPGGGGPPMGMAPMAGGLLPPFLANDLDLSEDQRKQLAELQKDADAKLDALLTPAQRTKLKAARERGPMFGMGPAMSVGGGVTLDPLVAVDDPKKPLRSKLLAVPALRAKYLANVRTIADKSLDWKVLGPVVAKYRALMEAEVAADTRKLSTTEAFRVATADAPSPASARGGREMPLRAFADARRAFLLAAPKKGKS